MSTPFCLSDAAKHRLRALMRQAELHPKVRERAEALLLLGRGWSVAEVAVHLERCAKTVRRWREAYEAGAETGLTPQRPGPVPADRSALDEAVKVLLSQPRTLGQLGEALAHEGRPTAATRCGRRWLGWELGGCARNTPSRIVRTPPRWPSHGSPWRR